MTVTKDSLQNLVDLTTQMLAAAQAGDFNRVAELESSRGRLLQSIEMANPSRHKLRSALLHIQTLDRQIVPLIEREREQAAAELEQIRTGRRVSQAYAEYKS